MNTNDSQFLKAYNDLVTAFFNFMNVVNPQGSQQPNLSYVASQLNQLLNYLAAAPQGGAPTTPQQPSGDYNTAPDPQPQEPNIPPVITDPVPPEDRREPAVNPTSSKPKYCPYPELVNGRYKFKSSSITNEPNEDSVYMLFLNENTQEGYVEICPLTGDTLKIVSNNPSLYMPLEICSNAGSITPDKNSVSSQSKLRLVKVVRGWEIADGEKFVLDVN